MNYKDFWAIRGKRPATKWSKDKQGRVRKILESIDFDSVLEVGCGDGEFSKLLLERTKNVTGIDLSLERIKASPLRITIHEDFLKAPFNNQKFDLVCCSHVLLHIKPGDVIGFYDKMKLLSNKHILLIEPDMFLYDSLEWDVMNFPHDYNRLFGPFEMDSVEPRVKAFIQHY